LVTVKDGHANADRKEEWPNDVNDNLSNLVRDAVSTVILTRDACTALQDTSGVMYDINFVIAFAVCGSAIFYTKSCVTIGKWAIVSSLNLRRCMFNAVQCSLRFFLSRLFKVISASSSSSRIIPYVGAIFIERKKLLLPCLAVRYIEYLIFKLNGRHAFTVNFSLSFPLAGNAGLKQ